MLHTRVRHITMHPSSFLKTAEIHTCTEEQHNRSRAYALPLPSKTPGPPSPKTTLIHRRYVLIHMGDETLRKSICTTPCTPLKHVQTSTCDTTGIPASSPNRLYHPTFNTLHLATDRHGGYPFETFLEEAQSCTG